MLRAARSLEARLLPHGVLDVLRQLVLFAAAYYLYRLVRGAVDGRTADAFDNARDLIGIERALGTFFEPALQSWAMGERWLIDFASWMYVNSHFTITTAALAYLYLRHNDSYYFVRNMFMVAMGIALVGYVAYPTAPPRFLSEWGFQDTVAQFTGIYDPKVDALYNPYAAVPSMHVGFALMIGASLARLARKPVVRGFWLFYPLLVTWVVVVTGNHFWLDAFLGAVTAAAAAWAALVMARARPSVWAFRPARVEAPA